MHVKGALLKLYLKIISLQSTEPRHLSANVFLDILFTELNSHLPSGPVHPYRLAESISNFRGLWCTFSVLFYFE